LFADEFHRMQGRGLDVTFHLGQRGF